MRTQQTALFDVEQKSRPLHRSGSFVDNMDLPVHRWFRYSAGFSAMWVAEVIRSCSATGECRVFDPFAGAGTTILEAERAGVESIGLEAHPFVARIARAKLAWRENPDDLRDRAREILATAISTTGRTVAYPKLIQKCFPKEVLAKLDSLRIAWEAQDDGSRVSQLCWLALAATLRPASPVGTAPWQYVLPRKSKARAADPFDAFESQVRTMRRDMAVLQQHAVGPPGQVLLEDARDCTSVPAGWTDLVITSPPYANNYDYADATRLEMCFFGEINGWGDLQSTVRNRLVRACTQHVAPYTHRTREVIESNELAPIRAELEVVCARLERERETHGGKKPYHAMIAHYFFDLAAVWRALRRVTRSSGKVCFVIGDSAPYGIHVPVERWLGELALAAGFKAYSFEKLRDRNTKWKNRKHRVPLHEGRLWVEA